MSMNNFTPAWMIGPFEKAYSDQERGVITMERFVEIIDALPSVPKSVVENWREKISIRE